ncbi:MAG TPA: hypothetical protein DCP69_11265 [Candidatus Omnitrophica bacterium]|nr:hypothetical protein [Candidatus Omnitrophota bacterium]
MGDCRIIVDLVTYETLAVEAAGAAAEYARAHGATVIGARVIVHPGAADEREVDLPGVPGR